MELKISVLADRPDLVGAMWEMPTTWPEFMKHDPTGNTYYALTEQFADCILLAEDPAGKLVAKAFSAPFWLPEGELPDDGWDGVIRRALRTKLAGQQPNAISAIEIAIRPDALGLGLSGTVLRALRENAGRLGFSELLAPVRPNGKDDPDLPMEDYVSLTREDGLPVDPWLRVHVRAGGVIERVAARSMVIAGSLAQWREWTGLPFDRSGKVYVPEALTPVIVDAEHGCAVYVEPNVWVRHKIPCGA